MSAEWERFANSEDPYMRAWADMCRYLEPTEDDLLDKIAEKHLLEIPTWDESDPLDERLYR